MLGEDVDSPLTGSAAHPKVGGAALLASSEELARSDQNDHSKTTVPALENVAG